ncbi:hypothetical protein JCM30237_17620 [Halolamina litorea]
MVAAAFGAVAVWRALSGVAAIVRWLWVGEFLGNGSMSLLLITVLVGPIVGAVAGDAALRRGFWSRSRAANRRRTAALVGLLLGPFAATTAVRWLLDGTTSLPLHGLVTLSVTAFVLLAAFGSGRDQREDGDGSPDSQRRDGGADGEVARERTQRDGHHRQQTDEPKPERQ